jgi:hypothetical protein
MVWRSLTTMMFCIAAAWFTLSTQPARRVTINVAHPYHETEKPTDAAVLPPNVLPAPEYRAIVEQMLRASETFRRQCARIRRSSGLTVTVQAWLSPDDVDHPKATTIFTRGPVGQLDALVRVSAPADPIELIAHEFEHILEQLDDVDLRVMAARHDSGVHLVSGVGGFETDRAIAAGRRVAAEVKHAVH